MQSYGKVNLKRIEALRTILRKPIKSDLDVARGISIIEEQKISIAILESVLENPLRFKAKRIGITGSPGVGKSTFMN